MNCFVIDWMHGRAIHCYNHLLLFSVAFAGKKEQFGAKRRWIPFPHSLWTEPIQRDTLFRIFSSIVQLISILFIIIIVLGSLAPGLYLMNYTYIFSGIWPAVFVGSAIYMLWCIIVPMVTVLAKWILIGRYKPGVHPIWGWYFMRWWIVQRLASASQASLHHIAGTPFIRWYLRLMGSKVGNNSIVKTVLITDYDLVSIGDNCIIGTV